MILWFQVCVLQIFFWEWLAFDLKYFVNLLCIVSGQCAFSGGDDFVVRVGSRCGDQFLGLANPYNCSPLCRINGN